MTLTEAAALLGLAASTLRRQAGRGHLHARKVGRDWQVSRAAVERYRRERWGRHGKRSGKGLDGYNRPC